MIQKNKEELVRLVKYFFSAGSSFLLDLLLFSLFKSLIQGPDASLVILISTILARIISSVYNYFINSRLVFKEKGTRRFLGYAGLVAVQALMSAWLVSLFTSLISIDSTIIKVFVDGMIFVVNYIVQKFVIFRK